MALDPVCIYDPKGVICMEKIYAYGGTFNPPHVAHMLAIREMIEAGADRIHVFVRINEGVDLVDKDTKLSWFERMKKDYMSTGWDRVIIHEAVSSNVKGKKYSLAVIRDSIGKLHEQAGEHITHYYAGDDYNKYKFFWKIISKDIKLVTRKRSGISSTMIRNNLQGYRFLIPDYVYDDIIAAQGKS